MNNTIDDLLENTEGKIVAFDLDLTLTVRALESPPDFMNTSSHDFLEVLRNAQPNKAAIEILNHFSRNNYIRIYTQRGEYAFDVTHEWLVKNGVNYDDVLFRKARYDIFFDDRAYNADILNGDKK